MTWKSPESTQIVHGIGASAPEVAERYFTWMTESLPGVIVARSEGEVSMYVRGSSKPAIVLRPEPESDDYAAFVVVGGYLVAEPPSGNFAFTKATTTLTIALRNFAPRLPAPIYLMSHYLVHAAVMAAFCRQLEPLQLEEMNV